MVNTVVPYLDYLTESQVRIYQNQLDPALREQMTSYLLASETKYLVGRARFILNMVGNYTEFQEAVTECFLRIFSSKNPLSCFERLEQLHTQQQIGRFFRFFTTDHRTDPLMAITEFQTRQNLQPSLRLPESTDHTFIESKYLSFTKTCSVLKKRIALVVETSRLPLRLYEKAFLWISVLKNCNEYTKSGIAQLIFTLTTNSVLVAKGYKEDDIKACIEAIQAIATRYGEEILVGLCAVFTHQPISIDECMRILHKLNTAINPSAIEDLLTLFMDTVAVEDYEQAKSQLIAGIDHINDRNFDTLPSEEELGPLLQRFLELPFPLSSEQLSTIASQYERIQNLCKERVSLSIEELARRFIAIRGQKEKSSLDLLEVMALVRLALWKHFNIYLNPTQILTVVGQRLFPQGCLAQVKTGEGKSMIVALLISLCVAQNKSVHVISSSPNLAIRDQQKFEAFFRKFGVVSSAICENNSPASCFQADVLYGTATYFEFALMREILYRKPLFQQEVAEKRFDCIIVDEVDNLTIDTSLSGARLASPAEKTYDWVYAPIFRFVQSLCLAKDVPLPHDAIVQARAFLERDMQGRFSNRVQDLTDEQLGIWLSSARQALFDRQEKIDYIIRDEQVYIIDAPNTGRILKGCRWSHGIHEFVEIKHGLPLQQESIVPISLSHPIYYTFYREIFGLSGTIGSSCEREEIFEMYGISSFDVPTYSPVKRIDSSVELCEPEIHLTLVIDRIIQYKEKGRPILVLCETIKETDKIGALLVQQEISYEMFNEEQIKSEEEILAKAGLPGAITLATNTAGRGTDINLDPLSIQNGGLHVLLVYFPESERVEWQARGRAGRQGQPGSSEMLIAKTEGMNQLEDFIAWREKMVRSKKDSHLRQAQIDRMRFVFTEKFFKKVSAFHAHLPITIGCLSRDFATRQLIDRTPVSLEALASSDRALAQGVLTLMTSDTIPENAIVSWKVILGQIAERIHTLILNDWAVRFYQKVDDFIWQAEKIRQCTSNSFENEGKMIGRIFNDQMTIWQKHLSPEGQGLIHYLRTIRSGRSPSLEAF